MRASTAYFVGAGTIVAAIAIGLGGGLVAGNIMHPVTPKLGPDTSKLESRADAVSTAAATSNAPLERVDYLTGSQAFGAVVAPAKTEPQANTANAGQPALQPAAANDSAPVNAADAKPARSTESKSTESKSAETKSTETRSSQAKAVEVKSADAKPTEQPSEKPIEKTVGRQAATEPAAAPENAFAKAKDSEVKRAAAERRRAERHERWAERRRHEARDPREMRDHTDWNDVARNIREDSDRRAFASSPRGNYPPPDRGPQIRLFGWEDDD